MSYTTNSWSLGAFYGINRFAIWPFPLLIQNLISWSLLGSLSLSYLNPSCRYFEFLYCHLSGILGGSSFKCRRRQWHPTPVFLPGKSHGWRSLVGCSPWSSEESDRTERLHFHFFLSCVGEGNGNPLQYSCLENPKDGGAWWAAVYGVAQSQTRMKQRSSSSIKCICSISHY